MTPTVTPDADRATALVSETDDERVVVRFTAELETDRTPLEAYTILADEEDYTFLLESAEKTASSDPDGAFRPSSADPGRHARFSYVGYDPQAVVTVGPDGTTVTPLGLELSEPEDTGDVLDTLRDAMPDVTVANPQANGRQRLEGGLVGYLAYDAVYDCWLEEVGLERPDSRSPDAEFVLTTSVLAFDEQEGSVSLVHTPLCETRADAARAHEATATEADRLETLLTETAPPALGGFERVDAVAGPRENYEEAVRLAKEHVRAGDIYQGVLSRERQLTGTVDPIGLYAALRDVNPSPYMYLLEFGPRTVVGASPETLVSVGGRTVTANPIAGTCPRGSSPVDDRRLAGEMLADEKERAEHTMLVDLARNDVRRVSEAGSVRVEEFMSVLKYSHVQHIESTVTGRLAADADAFDAIRAAFPAGTLSGAPKVRAMEIIDALETTPRGLYGGGVGYVSWTGDADVAIVIRTATVEDTTAPAVAAAVDDAGLEPAPHLLTVRAGAGIVADSDPAAEFDETEAKMDGVLAAIERLEAREVSR